MNKEMNEMITLTDSITLDGVRRTKDGYLAAYANVARTGVQKYKGWEVGRPSKEDVYIYRPPEEVFHKDALHSMAHRPVTLLHPEEVVDAKNWKKYAKGHTGDEVVRDGDHVRVPMVLMDAEAIDAVEKQGTRELSLGYSTDIRWTPGVTDAGEEYDGVQTAIRANHLAIVPVARGGSNLRFGDAGQVCEDCGGPLSRDTGVCDSCGKVNDGFNPDQPRDDRGRWSPASVEGGDIPERSFTKSPYEEGSSKHTAWVAGYTHSMKTSGRGALSNPYPSNTSEHAVWKQGFKAHSTSPEGWTMNLFRRATEDGFDPDQPRDDIGRWTSGTGPVAKTASEHKKAAEEHRAAAEAERSGGGKNAEANAEAHDLAAEQHDNAARHVQGHWKFAKEASKAARGLSVGANTFSKTSRPADPWMSFTGPVAQTAEEHQRSAEEHKGAAKNEQSQGHSTIASAHESAAKVHEAAAQAISSGHEKASDLSGHARYMSAHANTTTEPEKWTPGKSSGAPPDNSKEKDRVDQFGSNSGKASSEQWARETYQSRVSAAKAGTSKPLVTADPWINDDPRIAGWHGRWAAERGGKPEDNPYPKTSSNGTAWRREFTAQKSGSRGKLKHDAWLGDRDFSEEARSKAAESGAAMPDGSFPIKSVGDLENAIKAVGRAKNYDAAKRHIISRAKALGATSKLPEGWTTDSTPTRGTYHMTTTIMIDGAPVEVADDLSAAVIANKMKSLDAAAKKAKEDLETAEEEKKELEDGLKKSKSALDAATGEIAVLKKQVADAQVTPEKLDALVSARSAVLDAASHLLPRDFSATGKTLEDIRRAAVSAKLGDGAVKDMSDASVEGAFRALTADTPRRGTSALADSLSRPGSGGTVDARDAAHADYVKNISTAWQRKPAAN